MARRSGVCAVVVALVLCQLSATFAEMTWAACDSGLTPITASQVTLTPDPPVIGSPATFAITGKSEVALDAGSVTITVSFMGLQIYSQTEDLCTKTACPVKNGPVTITLVEDLPPIAPPGDYGLEVVARDVNSNELLCLKVDFQLVYPSAAGWKQLKTSAELARIAAGAWARRLLSKA